MNEQERQVAKEQLKNGATVGVSILTAIGVGVLSHDMPIALVTACLAFATGKLGPEVYKILVPGSDPDETIKATNAVLDRIAPVKRTSESLPQDAIAKLKRFTGIQKMPVGEAVRLKDDADRPLDERWSEEWYDDEEEDISFPSFSAKDRKYTFSDVLAKGFRPSLKQIFMGYLADGAPVYVAVKDLCHVALAGLTGNGKGNLMRLLMSQLCAVGVDVLLLNPHYMPYDQSGGEDWTPFIPKLKKHPADCASYEAIGEHLRWMTKTLLAKRIERGRNGQPIGKPFFCVIDEWPAIVGKVKDAPEHMGELLREGRKYGIYLILASQDFQVKTIGVDGGGVRKCFKTVFYVGGDRATANALLGTDEAGNALPIKENELGSGGVILRCSAVKYALPEQVPFVDNEALYTLLGPSTLTQYLADDDEPETDELSDLGREFAELMKAQADDAAQKAREDVKPVPIPIVQEKGPKAEDIDIVAAIAMWNAGFNSEDKLIKAFPGLTKYQAGKLRDRILEQVPKQEAEVK